MSFTRTLWSQYTIIPISPKPVGSGARALGQSAFIAVADDATAASWNPAGLINLEKPEASFVGAWKVTTKDYSAAVSGFTADQDKWSDSELNFMSYAQPLQLRNTDLVLSINYHQVYDFGVEFNSSSTITTKSDSYEITSSYEEKGRSVGAVSAYSLAGGLSIPSYPQITFGAGFNWYTKGIFNDYVWQVKKTMSRSTLVNGTPLPPFEETDIETFDDFSGHNFTLGLLWDAYEREENLLTFGFVYHTPFTARVDRELTIISDDTLPWPLDRMDIDFPSSLGAGVNYRISDSLSAAFDVEWKEWSKFKQKHENGTSISPIDDNTLAYRLGGEYLSSETDKELLLAYRGGLFYEPRPVGYGYNTISIYGFSVGLGWTLREQFSLDFAYQYRWGEEEPKDFDYKIKEQFFVASVITYF